MTIKHSHCYRVQRAEVSHNLTLGEAGTKSPDSRRASIEKARRILGCEPKMKIEEGINKTHDWIMGIVIE